MRKILEIMALSAALLLPLSGMKATAQEIPEEPKIELIVNYETGTQQTPLDYLTSINAYSRGAESLWRTSNIPELTSIEETEVEDIMSDIQNNNINSYQELIETSQDFSENQKLVLASAIAYSLNLFNYDINLLDSELLSQDDFFSKLQDSLETGEQNPLGVCKHIVTHTEKILNDLEIRSSAVSGLSSNGVGHVYVISKTEDGRAIVDACYILTTDTNNIEKTLQAYQKFNGVATFQHLFFENDEFQYRLITKDGENFLDFIEYDESSEPLKSSLIENIELQPNVSLTLNIEDYLTSIEANMLGLFVKMGETKGNDSSALKKMNIAQIGFKRNFSILDFLNVNPDLSLILGGITQDTELENNQILGVNGNLIINTNFEKGFNLTSRVGGIGLIYENPVLDDFILGAGISYTLPIENINIQPYIVSQFDYFANSLATWKFAPRFTELNTGISFDYNSDSLNFSANPYYLWRIWEQGFGGEVELETRDTNASIGIHADGQMTFSTYDFCPDKYNFSVGSHLSLGNFEVSANYQREGTDYDGEQEIQESFNIQGSIKF